MWDFAKYSTRYSKQQQCFQVEMSTMLINSEKHVFIKGFPIGK
jgi:hypothetical protein